MTKNQTFGWGFKQNAELECKCCGSDLQSLPQASKKSPTVKKYPKDPSPYALNLSTNALSHCFGWVFCSSIS